MANDIESFVAATEPESAPSSQPDSAVARWYSGEDESSRVGLSVKAAQDITPDAATRVNKLQAKTGLPEDLIHRNLDEIEKINNASDFDPAKFMKSSPTVAKWMAESPTNSAIVKDNLSGVENIEHTVQDYGLMQTLYRALASGTSSAEAGIAKIPSVISNSMLLPYNATVKYISKRPDLQFSFPTANPISDYFDAQASGVSVPEQRESIVGTANLGGIAKEALDLNFSGVMREIDKGNFTRAGRILATQFAANLPQQAAIMAATFYGYANPALVGMGATQAASVMSEGQAKDADPTALTVDALLQGTIESGFESLGTFGLLKHWENAIANQYGKEVSGRIIKDFTKTLLHTAAGEGNEEFLTQIAQDYSDYITGINPDAMKGTFKRALDAGLIGATSGAAVTGPGAFMAGVSRGAQMRQTHLAREFYENLGKAVEESKLNETSPETTATLVSRMVQDSPINSVYIAPEALEEKITSLGQDPLKVIQSIGFGKEYSEAKAAGTQMQIPLADWTAKSGELYQSMADDIKFQPEGMSVNDTVKLKEQVKAAEESAKAAEEAKTPEQTSAEQVGANVIEQLKAAGFDEGIAQTYAKLYETAFGTLGQRAGIDPAKLFEQYGLQIRRPDIQPTGTPGSTEMAQETPESPIPKDLPVIEDKAKEGEPYAVFDYNWQLSKETPTLAYFKVFGDPARITEMTKNDKQPSGNGWGSDITLDTIKASGIPIKGKTARAVGEPSLESLQEPISLQPQPDSPRQRAETLSDLLKSESFVTQGYGSLSVPARTAMFSNVMGTIDNNPKIINSIVSALPIDVVNNLFGSKSAANKILHDESMLKTRLAVNADLSVPLSVDTSDAIGLFLREVATQGTKQISVSPGAGLKTPEGGSATGADKINRLSQGERAVIRFGANRQFNIDLLKTADLSSFLHETGHFYLEVLGDLASNPNATPEIKTDLATIYKYLGVESRDQIEREHHEKFARSFEAYLMEGKAPTSALRAAFARFKSWLTAIYRQVKGLNVELTPEVRDVFDRLIASEDEIAAARAENEMTPLFSDPKSVGMTDAQAESYTKAVLESKTEAEDELTSQLMKEANRKQKQWWLNEREKVEKEVSEKVDQDTEQIALAVLQKGTLPNGNELPENLKNLKLSKKAIVEQFKDYPIKNLPKPHVYTAEGGLHPDVAATLFGFKSGSELLFALETAPKRETLINQQVDAQMQARHGDLMKNPFQMYEAAKKAIHNDKQAHLLRTELQHLASNNLPALKGVIRNVTRSIPTVEAVRNQAEAIIADKRVRDIQPNLYQRAEIKAGRDAVNSVLKGDFDTAFEAKRRELLNHELYRAATNAQETTEKTVDYMSKFNKDTVRAKLGKAGEEYLDQIDSIMERFDFRKGVSLRAIDRKKAMVNWVNEQRAQGNDPQISDAVLNEAYQQSYKDVQMSVLVGVRDSVRSIEHLASLKNKLMANEAQRNLEEAKESIVSSIKAFHDLTPEPIEYAPTFKKNMMTKVQSFAASHTRMEFLFKFLDGNKPQGKAWETFFKPMADAENNENRMMKEVVENLNGIFGEYTRKERASWFLNRIWIPEIQNHMTKANLMTLALNMGNDYNREAVMQGRSWTDQQLQAMLKHLDARDIKTVNAVWKYIETFKEPSFALERDLNGLEPEAVEGTPYKIKAGTLEGGYYPIVFDKTLPWKAPELQAQATLRDMFEGNWGVAMTKHNHLKERTATGGKPILLEMTGLTQHLSDVVHDLSYRRAVIDSYKMMNQPEIRDAITAAAGSEMYKQLNPWLKAIAGERRNAPANPVEGIFGRARSGATVVNLGLKVTSGLVQTLGYLNTVKEVGANYAIKGLRDVYLKPWKFNEKWDFCSQRSGMMRDRIENWDRDIRDAMKKLSVTSDPSLLSETLRDMGLQNTAENIEVAKSKTSDMQKSFFAFVGYMDLAMSVPTWLAAYRKGMDGKIENVNAGDEKAVSAYADSIVRQTQSAGGIKDSAAIQRGSEAFKLFTMFYSQLSLQFNQFQDIHNEFRLNHNKPALIGALSLLWFIPAVLEDLVRGRPPDGDDEDKWKKWIVRKEFLYPFQTIILGRDLASSADRYLQTGQADYQGSPIFDAGASLVRTGAIPLKLVTGDEITRSDIRSAFNTAGYVFRLPTKQMWMTAQYLYDWMTGDESPTTPVHGIFHALVGGKTP